MVFSTHLFVFWFLPLALAVYYLTPRRGRHLGLTLLSYLFYGWANPAFTILMAFSTVVDYLCGLALVGGLPRPWRARLEPLEPGGLRTRGQKAALGVSVVTNLALLGFFKYFNFGVDSWNAVAESLGLSGLGLETTLRVTLPLGISFYTFQSMSYTIDVYRGKAVPLRDFIDFACYVSLFPQLVAGPIVRFQEIADQLVARTHGWAKMARGAAFLSLGMAKKVLLANPCGKVADTAFEAGGLTAPDAWTGLFAYSFQIYFDFSGYSDMAIGLGLMLGFVLPKNFDSPYKAISITDFWRRWHLSLSTWLRDYLYLPLGGNRKGPARTYVNLALVMLLGGLWHGASWNFVLWGGWHGLLLAAERAFGKRPLYARLPAAARRVITFLLVTVAWVPFRAPDLATTGRYLGDLLGVGPAGGGALISGLIYRPYYLGAVLLAAGIAFALPQTWDWTRRLPAWKAALCLGLFWLSLVALTTQEFNPFIYFIF
jgi:alginate O-acetyltransferase complex protein AlgI